MNEPLVECVPNFSEGRDEAVIERLVSAMAGVPGVMILDRTSDWDHHRTVITAAGPEDALIEAAVRAAGMAARFIDLNAHCGIHPRVGALDVLPFVPLRGGSIEDCARIAHRAGERITDELGIPVYFYGAAALTPTRTQLENIRNYQFEVLRDTVETDLTRAPDRGGPGLHQTAGAVMVGARKILIAFNINLDTEDVAVAKRIARSIRTSSGGFLAVKALGLRLASRGLTQVSMNLTDFELTPLHVVYAAVTRLAAAEGVAIHDSELIGLLPKRAVEAAFSHFLRLPEFGVIEERLARPPFAKVKLPGPFLAGETLA